MAASSLMVFGLRDRCAVRRASDADRTFDVKRDRAIVRPTVRVVSVGRFLLATIDGGGTLPPEMGLAAELVGRGHSVEVLSGSDGAGFRGGGGVRVHGMADRAVGG